jgi:two-component system response regulator PilR (NtrC family)
MAKILVVDDEQSMREFLEILLSKEGHEVVCVDSGEPAVQRSRENEDFDLVITDLKMPRVGGIEVLETFKRSAPEIEVIVMTAYSTTETAIQAMKKGAYDYLSKPFQVDEIRVIIEKCLEKRALSIENRRLRSELRDRYRFDKLLGKSAPIQKVFDIIQRVSLSRASVLVSGETGTGKELIARAIHFNSPRKDRPFIVVNCGAIPDQLMESELFGHVKGSFTGAVVNKKGLFDVASGGTLFLDEIGEMGLQVQVKLLRALQERKIKPVGGLRETEVDVRIIAATNRNLEEEVLNRTFRDDLYYRLNVIGLTVPPLRDRREDIPLLAHHFLEKFAQEMAKPLRGFEPDVLEALCAYKYSGNVRELENIVEHAVTFELGDAISVSSLPASVLQPRQDTPSWIGRIDLTNQGLDMEGLLSDIERRYLLEALRLTRGVKTDAAKLLNISFRSIRYKLEKYNISDTDIQRYQ